MPTKKTTTKKATTKTVKRDSVEVVLPFKRGVRVYSKEVHGKDFEKLAKSFADKFDGLIQ